MEVLLTIRVELLCLELVEAEALLELLALLWCECRIPEQVTEAYEVEGVNRLVSMLSTILETTDTLSCRSTIDLYCILSTLLERAVI